MGQNPCQDSNPGSAGTAESRNTLSYGTLGYFCSYGLLFLLLGNGEWRMGNGEWRMENGGTSAPSSPKGAAVMGRGG